ncbi:MAG: putative dehydrogenase [Bacteriovoracaceae bacterium]|nr:putative dehydrogenase [Bacteriovoracaceae bacterium]
MKAFSREIRYGMVGGGIGSFIGPIHRTALQMLSPKIRLVSANFSTRKEICDQTAEEVGLDLSRSYYDYETMAKAEAKRPAGERADFIIVVTPNRLHFSVSKLFLENGFHVFCEKPLTRTSAEAEILQKIATDRKLLFGVMYGYTGYPMIKEARRLVHEGALGKIRKVFVEYAQSWLTDPIELEGQKQAAWRTNPSESGGSLSMGDIGSHCENMVSYVSGLQIKEISGELSSFVDGRILDDDAMVLLKFVGGASGILFASQVLTGELNHFRLRIYGDKAGLRWDQMDPERLEILEKDGTIKILSRGAGSLSKWVGKTSYLPAGHPEGVIEAFSNHYAAFISKILHPNEKESDFPGIEEGVRGMKFIESVLKSSKSNQKWTELS